MVEEIFFFSSWIEVSERVALSVLPLCTLKRKHYVASHNYRVSTTLPCNAMCLPTGLCFDHSDKQGEKCWVRKVAKWVACLGWRNIHFEAQQPFPSFLWVKNIAGFDRFLLWHLPGYIISFRDINYIQIVLHPLLMHCSVETYQYICTNANMTNSCTLSEKSWSCLKTIDCLNFHGERWKLVLLWYC